jgi:hypothetical protein
MSSVMELNTVRDTTLWKRLDTGFTGKDSAIAKTLAVNVEQLCQEASKRVKNFYSSHPQYTLHDEIHFARVTELMSMIIPQEALENLNPIETALLILAAYYHDQGMVLTGDDMKNLKENKEFIEFRDNWLTHYPNYFEIQDRLRTAGEAERNKCIQLINEFNGSMTSDFIRTTHGRRSSEYVLSLSDQDKRWEIAGANLGELTAQLCYSHVSPATELIPANGFRYDESVGTLLVNMPFLGIVLRLADILDFDRDRTPSSLFRSIHFTNTVSFGEWTKHQSVKGWLITSEQIRFTMKCDHPVYQKMAFEFMDWIDQELINSNELVRGFPHEVAVKYPLHLPIRVDRSRIEPKHNSYKYMDLEFSLSRDTVVNLLMTDKLYTSPSLCIRELIQNSLDALRHRKAILKRDNSTSFENGHIVIEHFVDEDGYENLSCTDNGVGMNESIIRRFLTNAGRSYYKSPEFLQERSTFAKVEADFDPCGQFGIGFMSSFMFGDRIKIWTRRDLGPNVGLDEPLIIEINGLGGIIVIRKGSSSQPAGTKIQITGRKKPKFLDESEDIVNLVNYVGSVCLACEFPIQARCTIPEIAAELTTSAIVPKPITILERYNIENIVTFEQNISDIHPLMSGTIRNSFLVDEEGQITLSNHEASFEIAKDEIRPYIFINCQANPSEKKGLLSQDAICLDGILVVGFSEDSYTFDLEDAGIEANILYSGYDSFLIDIRSQIKPILTPARTANFASPTWDKIEYYIGLAHGRLWGKVLYTVSHNPELFWKLMVINNTSDFVGSISFENAYEHLKIPLKKGTGEIEWIPLKSSGKFQMVHCNEENYQLTNNGLSVTLTDGIEKWITNYRTSIKMLDKSIIANATVTVQNEEAVFEIKEPQIRDRAPLEFSMYHYHHERLNIQAIPFSYQLSKVLSVGMIEYAELPKDLNKYICIVNRNHPIVTKAIDSRYLIQQTDENKLCSLVTGCLSSPATHYFLATESTVISKLMRALGRMAASIDWAEISKEFHPPYFVWLNGKGEIIITFEELISWATSDVLDQNKF